MDQLVVTPLVLITSLLLVGLAILLGGCLVYAFFKRKKMTKNIKLLSPSEYPKKQEPS